MSIFFWIIMMIVAAKLADGASEMMKARADRIQRGGGGPRELEGLREEVRALSDRLDITERTAQDAEEKVRFLEGLLAAPAPAAGELPRGSGEQRAGG